MVFKFAREADALSRTARSLGISFAELKSAGDEAKRFGGTMEEAIRNAAGVQEAITDLARNGSQLRAELLGKGLDPRWLDAWRQEEKHHERQNMARREALLIEQELAKTRGPIAAAGERNAFLRRLGYDPAIADRPPLPAPDPRLNEIAAKSKIIADIWSVEIYPKIMGINFTAQIAGLDTMAVAMRVFNQSLELAATLIPRLNLLTQGWASTTWSAVKALALGPLLLHPGVREWAFPKDQGLNLPNIPPSNLPPTNLPARPTPYDKLFKRTGFGDGEGGFGGGGGANVDDRLQGIIKGGVFDALVEYAAFAAVGGKGGFQNAALTVGGGGAAAGGGFHSGGGFSLIAGSGRRWWCWRSADLPARCRARCWRWWRWRRRRRG